MQFAANPAVAAATVQQVAAYAAAAAVSTDEIGVMLEKFANEVELLLTSIGSTGPGSQQVALHNLLEAIIATRRARDANTAMNLLKRVIYLLNLFLGFRFNIFFYIF